MGFFEELFGIEDNTKNNIKMEERDIVNDMLKDSKFALTSLVKTIGETSNPQMREVLKQQLNTSIKNHFRLVDIATEKEWYKPYLNPMDQMKEDYEISKDLTQ